MEAARYITLRVASLGPTSKHCSQINLTALNPADLDECPGLFQAAYAAITATRTQTLLATSDPVPNADYFLGWSYWLVVGADTDDSALYSSTFAAARKEPRQH